MNCAVLSFKEVGLAYRRKLNPFSKKDWILRDISFDLYRGEVLGVIGKNGAGKSTLLKLLADIINPDTGHIWREPKIRSQLLSLQLGFNPQLTGYDNTIMALVMLGKSIQEARSLIPKIIEFSEIGHLMDHLLHTYSSGEKARLGFSIAMNATPDILLLDEILGVGDKDFKEKSSAALKSWIKADQTAILVSHHTNTLLEFCSRVLWIENGVIREIGPTNEVLGNYLGQDPEKLRRKQQKVKKKLRAEAALRRQMKRERMLRKEQRLGYSTDHSDIDEK